jgi:hypothetical protein
MVDICEKAGRDRNSKASPDKASDFNGKDIRVNLEMIDTTSEDPAYYTEPIGFGGGHATWNTTPDI